MRDQQQVVICQSCGAALYRAVDFGSDAEGNRGGDYCRDCFQSGRFIEPHLTLEDMVERIAKPRCLGETEKAAFRNTMRGFLGNLARWHGESWTPLPSTIAIASDPDREEPSP